MKKNNSKIYILYIIIGTIIIIGIVFRIIYSITTKTNQYVVKKGKIDKTEIVEGYLVKDETTISKRQDKVLIPIIPEKSRVSKGAIIATYKGEEYTSYKENLEKLDKEILTLMKELPTVYSSEVNAIDNNIYYLIKESIQENSYSKMQEYIQKINDYVSKRASIIGNLSPSGAKIKELIEKRNDYVSSAKNSNDNIIAPNGGVVLYQTDGLENLLKASNISKLTYLEIENLIYSNSKNDNTKLKIVNNYEAYIVANCSSSNLQFMKENAKYKLRLLDQKIELEGTLVKYTETDDGVEVYFKVTNGIENIAALRNIELEIVWKSYQGFLVPLNTLYKTEDEKFYVKMIRYMEYVDILVKVNTYNEGYAILSNYSVVELEKLGKDSSFYLDMHDRILIKNSDF